MTWSGSIQRYDLFEFVASIVSLTVRSICVHIYLLDISLHCDNTTTTSRITASSWPRSIHTSFIILSMSFFSSNKDPFSQKQQQPIQAPLFAEYTVDWDRLCLRVVRLKVIVQTRARQTTWTQPISCPGSLESVETQPLSTTDTRRHIIKFFESLPLQTLVSWILSITTTYTSKQVSERKLTSPPAYLPI